MGFLFIRGRAFWKRDSENVTKNDPRRRSNPKEPDYHNMNKDKAVNQDSDTLL